MRLPITEYGRRDLLVATVVCWAAIAVILVMGRDPAWLRWVAVGPLAVWLILVNFFRDPERRVPEGAHLVLAPADGVVTDITDVVETEFLGGPASRLGIFLSPLNVHVNRMPMACRVVQVKHAQGRMLKAYDPRAIDENESAQARIEVLDGRFRMIVRQVTGALARRIVCPLEPGTRYAAGERYGMIKFGSRTEVWVPPELGVRWSVAVGEKVKGGLTVLGVVEPGEPDGSGDRAP